MDSNRENSSFSRNICLPIQGDLKVWDKAIVMGILNLTPDSFYDGNQYQYENDVLTQVEKLIEEGADIIDIGAFSSRPGAQMISAEEELKRLLTPLDKIRKRFPKSILSIDTYRKAVAESAIDLGADIINDISGGEWDKELPPFLAVKNIPYILMHMQGRPEHMQTAPTYSDVSKEVYQWMSKKLDFFDSIGLKDLIIDPGFGFGKTLEHNYQLLKDLTFFEHLNRPILVGISRKGMIQKVIHKEAKEALNGTTAAHVLALLNGANILRVHDVKEAKEAIAIVDYYQKQ